jgi:transposase
MRHNYDSLITESEAELKALVAKHRNSVTGSRLSMLYLLKSGQAKSLREASEQLHYSRRHCQRWLNEYQQDGLSALLAAPKKAPGPRERMTPAAWSALKQALLAGEIATYRQARLLLAKHGVHYQSDTGVLKLFKRHKIKAKTGRPRHEKADVAAQAAFKKT